MKRLLLVGALAALSVSPARAYELDVWHEVAFQAPVPCSVVCPYWMDTFNTDADASGKDDIYFQACANPDGTADALADAPGLPYEAGTVFDDFLIGPAPEGAVLLELELLAEIDWDGFVCDPETGEELAQLANLLGHECRLHPMPIGCPESGSLPAEPGKSYIFRAYNWSDAFPAHGRFRFR